MKHVLKPVSVLTVISFLFLSLQPLPVSAATFQLEAIEDGGGGGGSPPPRPDPPPLPPGAFHVFGPKTYVRGTGAPQTITDTFQVLNPSAPYTLRVVNGGLQDGLYERVSSTVITVNGIRLVGPNNFNQNVAYLEVPVTLTSSNTISVEVRSKPGGALTAEIIGVDTIPPVVQILSPQDGALFDTETVQVQIALSDNLSGLDPSTFQVKVDGIDKTSLFPTPNPALSDTISGTLTLDAGDHTLLASIKDKASNAGQSSATFTVVLNRPPILNPIGNQTIPLGGTLQFIVSAMDPDNDPLTFAVGPLPLPPNVSFNSQTGTFSFMPSPSQIGSFQLLFAVTDGVFTDSELVTIEVTVAPPAGSTRLSGTVLETTGAPLEGVLIEAGDVSTFTDTEGHFLLTDVPPSTTALEVHGESIPPAGTFPFIAEDIELILEHPIFPGQLNDIIRPIFLPRLDLGSADEVIPGQDTLVTSDPALASELFIAADTLRNPDGSSFAGMVSITEVPPDLTPAALPRELEPATVVTIQPGGLNFTQPALLSFPNTENLTPGSELDLWSINPETGRFDLVGVARVTPDGSRIETIQGGVRSSSWHFVLPPAPTGSTTTETTSSKNQDETRKVGCPVGSLLTVSEGVLSVDHALPTYRTLGQSRALRLVYNALTAHPAPILSVDSEISVRAAVPPQLSSAILKVGGVSQGDEVFYDTSALPEDQDSVVRQAVQFDASSYATGVYDYEIKSTSHYAMSSVSSMVEDTLIIHNRIDSPFGAGWGLDGLQRLQRNPDGTLLITEGDGSAGVFNVELMLDDQTIGRLPSFQDRSFGVDLGDVDGDGDLDIALANQASGGSGRVRLFINNGLGVFQDEGVTRVPFIGSNMTDVELLDVDADSDLDMFITTDCCGSGMQNRLLINDGAGVYTDETSTRLPAILDGSRDAEAGDFDGDGDLDIFVSNGLFPTPEEDCLFINNGLGFFVNEGDTRLPSMMEGSDDVSVGDIDGDGDLDIFVSNSFPGELNRLYVNCASSAKSGHGGLIFSL